MPGALLIRKQDLAMPLYPLRSDVQLDLVFIVSKVLIFQNTLRI